MTAKKLYVGQLPKGCTSQMLSEIFEKFGTVSECDVIRNYGFVHMTNETEAQEAVTNLDDSNFMGSSILVQFSTTDVHKAPGVGSQGECFRCGKRGHLSRECPEGGTKPRRRGPRGGGGRGGSRSGGGYGGSRDHGHSSRDYWDSYYYDYPPPRRLPPPGYDYDRRPPYPRDYPYPPAAYRDRSRSPAGRRPPPDPYMRRGRSPPRDYRDYYDRPPMPRDYYDMPPPRRDAPVSYPLPPAYNRDPYPERPRYRPDARQQAPPHRPPFPSKSPIASPIAPPKRLPFAYANGNSAKPAGQVNGSFTEDVY